MAEQARKLGARIAELRDERHWKQRDLVAEMAAAGDQSLNTNQLSRYENGGAVPGEKRLQLFAKVFGTTIGDLYAGPVADRKPKPEGSPLDGLSRGASAAEVADLRERLDWMESALQALLADRGLEQVAPRSQPGTQQQTG